MHLPVTKLPKDPTDRLFYTCDPSTAKFLRAQWAECEQLDANDIPTDGLPVAMIMACYAQQVLDTDIMEDYDELVRLTQKHLGDRPHPYNYLLTFMCQYRPIAPATWDDIGMEDVFDSLLPL